MTQALTERRTAFETPLAGRPVCIAELCQESDEQASSRICVPADSNNHSSSFDPWQKPMEQDIVFPHDVCMEDKSKRNVAQSSRDDLMSVKRGRLEVVVEDTYLLEKERASSCDKALKSIDRYDKRYNNSKSPYFPRFNHHQREWVQLQVDCPSKSAYPSDSCYVLARDPNALSFVHATHCSSIRHHVKTAIFDARRRVAPPAVHRSRGAREADSAGIAALGAGQRGLSVG